MSPSQRDGPTISSTCHYISFLLLIGIFDVGSEIKMADSYSENVNHGGIHLDHLWTVRLLKQEVGILRDLKVEWLSLSKPSRDDNYLPVRISSGWK